MGKPMSVVGIAASIVCGLSFLAQYYLDDQASGFSLIIAASGWLMLAFTDLSRQMNGDDQ